MTDRLQIHYSRDVRHKCFAIIGLFCVTASAQVSLPVIIDTDAGSDDLMAIAFLLARHDLTIQAITVANGLAHVRPGARNMARLLELAGRRDIPVYVGRSEPLEGHAEFPAGWRRWWREESLIDGTDWTTLLAGADQVLRELRAQHVARSS